MKLSEKITLLRKQKGFSQEDLANMLDVSRQAVYKWENDASMPDIDKIKKMASLFDISFDRLLNDQIDITQQNTANSNIVNTAKVYRDVFNSGFKLNYNQPDIDHGYTENRNKKLKQSQPVPGKRWLPPGTWWEWTPPPGEKGLQSLPPGEHRLLKGNRWIPRTAGSFSEFCPGRGWKPWTPTWKQLGGKCPDGRPALPGSIPGPFAVL